MKFEGPISVPSEEKEEMEEFDPRLEELWEKYKLSGQPPRMGSKAETRLKEKCSEYAGFSIGDKTVFSTADSAYKYDIRKRQLHNEIAIMVVGQQRSGMKASLAQNIANFVIEYITGFENGKVNLPEKREE